ncbi:hypothetical protein K493DRAFT_333512 [Basidiobolus meristosporus CBS 931.73]|uniref:SEC7-like protein n=1 Tax=Basidiobolus meristosporus CBS 931.73 TaxID=1314790 RepID=A0A1Y1Z5K8_9FUNG|nr:hypothetical protein K493DRAFT_333512 [Basidiobolus meristosporus CBS 931.73]|eukprot:ORY05543.1 hypothetical protein K493DRAFT_333512 [Basidiobolus meristosporus CBS 931.73]
MSDPQPTILVTESPIREAPASEFNLRVPCFIPTDFIRDSLDTFNNDAFLDELAPGLRIEQEAAIIAKKLYLDDKDMFKKEEIAQFLGNRGELNALTLEKYLNHFDFSRMRLEDAFRYWECNHNGVFPNQGITSNLECNSQLQKLINFLDALHLLDTVYTIVYSLLLLNTDLHVANINNKISKHDFVKNTLATVRACTLLDTNHDSSIHSFASRTNLSSRSSSFGSESDCTISGSRASLQDDLTSLLKEMYTSVKHNQIPQPFDCKPRRRSSSMGMIGSLGLTRSHSVHTLRKVRSKLSSKPSSPIISYRSSRNSFNTESSNTSVGSSEPPSPSRTITTLGTSAGIDSCGYSKSGQLARKHLFERTDKKAHNRQWKNCYLVVNRGDLKMFKSSKGHSCKDGNDRMETGVQMGHIPLRHSLTIALPPPGYSPTRPHVFAVQLPNGGVYLFQTESREQVQEWVNVCNYWSARESKEPMPGGVCNIDYGWMSNFEPKTTLSTDLHLPVGYDDHVSISEWAQPTNPMIRSNLSEDVQLQTLIRHNAFLEKELAEHMELRSVIVQRFSPKSSNMHRAFSNWERKSQHLLRELIKYQTYADTLKQAMDFPSDTEDDATYASGPRHSSSDVFVPSPLRQSQRSVTAPAKLAQNEDHKAHLCKEDLEKTRSLQIAGLNEVTEEMSKIGVSYDSVFPNMPELELDDESVYELCREHLSSSDSE